MKNTNLDSQDLADLWVKKQFNTGVRIAKVYWKKAEKLKRKLVKHDWKNDYKEVESVYYANKALYYNASRNLPFKTLTLIGRILSDKTTEHRMKAVIKDNVFSFEGQIFKLDDLESQAKIRKALRSVNFKKVEVDAAA